MSEKFIKYIALNFFPDLSESFVNKIAIKILSKKDRKELIKELYPKDIFNDFFKERVNKDIEVALLLGSLSRESTENLENINFPFTYAQTIDLLKKVGGYTLLEYGADAYDEEEYEKVGVWYGGGACDEEWVRTGRTISVPGTPDVYGYTKKDDLRNLFNLLIQYDREMILKIGFSIDKIDEIDYVYHSRWR